MELGKPTLNRTILELKSGQGKADLPGHALSIVPYWN